MQNLLEDDADHSSSIDLQHLETTISELRNQIRDLGSEVDAFKAKKGGAIGGSVFLLLLALIALYDLVNGKSNLWLAVGISGQMLKLITVGFVAASLALFSVAAILEKTRDQAQEAKLAELEQELETLLARKSALEST